LLKSILDPRAYLHLLKLINFYNYSHVRELRLILLGRNVSIAPSVMFANGDRIAIDDGTIIGPRCYLWAGHEFGHIFIGRNVMFGPQVMVTAATYRFHDGSPMRDQAMEEEDVVIGDDVWIGTGAVILPGARIGEGSVIGAGSIVRGEIPPRSIAVGAPARVAGHR
jgi:acetyltransferase-like isoleucine patch superfamily enzyme